MKIIKPSHELMLHTGDPYQHIERIGRICYRSEDAITKDSAEPFCRRMFNSGHHAMLEHFRFIVVVNQTDYKSLIQSPRSKYLTFTHDGRYMISASARGLNDMYKYIANDINSGTLDDMDTIMAEDAMDIITDIVHEIINDYHCPMIFAEHFREYDTTNPSMQIINNFNDLSDIEYNQHAWYSIHFVCDRGVTHEMVRHRDASFAQESTRYCNYGKGKFNNEITVIEPMFWEKDSEEYKLWWLDCKHSEETYNSLIGCGAKPQEARSVLPNSLKTEIVITAQVYEWRHIFNLRVLGTTGAPHPQIKEVMSPAYEQMLCDGYLR